MTAHTKRRRRPRRRVAISLMLGAIIAILAAPFSGLLMVDTLNGATAYAQEGQGQGQGNQVRQRNRYGAEGQGKGQGNQVRQRNRYGAEDPNPRSNFWRAVRQGDSGYSAVSGPESNVLINANGENWRAIRNGPLATYGTWLFAAIVVACLLTLIIRGRIKIEGGRSGLTVPRWNVFERVMHWYVAILFLFLMVTGLSMLYGRVVLIPLIGKDAFAAYASLCMTLHNYLGPAFAVGLVVMVLVWLKMNLVKKIDLTWFAKGGGIFSKEHASAGRVNGGEKAWYWLMAIAGLASVATGLILDFPQFGQDRGQMQLSHLIHVGGGLILSAAFLGHWYIATLGTEGTLEAMVEGRVDEQWAKQHHDLWVEELREKGVTGERIQYGSSGNPQPRST